MDKQQYEYWTGLMQKFARLSLDMQQMIAWLAETLANKDSLHHPAARSILDRAGSMPDQDLVDAIKALYRDAHDGIPA